VTDLRPGSGPGVRADAVLIQRYEQLRGCALGASAQGYRHGLGVLTGKGMAAWMHAWAGCPTTATPRTMPVTAPAATTPLASGVATGEIVAVLAAMTLACTRPRPCGTPDGKEPAHDRRHRDRQGHARPPAP